MIIYRTFAVPQIYQLRPEALMRGGGGYMQVDSNANEFAQLINATHLLVYLTIILIEVYRMNEIRKMSNA